MRIGKHRLVSGSLVCVAALAASSLPVHAQATASNEWAWIGGSNATSSSDVGPPGVYGTLGTPSSANLPGIRWGASDWTDSAGNFWLFGGHGVDANGTYGFLNDLWEFDPATGEWTWMSGSSIVIPLPQAQDCEDNDCGQPGVYGTLGTAAPGNVPGGRDTAASWSDDRGNFWMFGGYGFGAIATGSDGILNDLWMYNPTTNEWTWMAGNTSDGNDGPIAIPGVYGTLGTPAAGNLPGGRDNASSFTDSSGNFWLFGGVGYDSTGQGGILNDLWKFNPSSHEWAWMGGDNRIDQDGVYGTLGTPATGNVPGAREGTASWTDGSGNFWLFGGFGYAAGEYGYGYLNDLWEFAPSSMEWTWMGGSSTLDPDCMPLKENGTIFPGCPGAAFGQPGVYGDLGTPSASNVPSSRWTAATWTDRSGNFWLFGGQGYDANYYAGYLNDFWELNISTSPVQWTWMAGSSTIPASCAGQEVVEGDTVLGLLTCGQPGTYGLLGTLDGSNIPGGRNTASFWTDKNRDLWLFGGYGFDSSGNSGALSDLWAFQSTIGTLPAVQPVFSPPSGIYTAGRLVTISDATPGASIYYTTDGSAPTASSPSYSGPITVSATETIQAISAASGYAVSASASATYTIAPATQTPTFDVPGGSYATEQSVAIRDGMQGAILNYTTDGTAPSVHSPIYSGPVTVSSTETLNAIATAPGYATSAVATASYTISPGFSISASPASVTSQAGNPGNTVVTVSPWGGFSSTVSFACSGLPASAVCIFSPATVTPTSSAAVTTTLYLSVTESNAAQGKAGNPALAGAAFACLLCLLGVRWRPLQVLGLCWIVFVALLAIWGCGSNGGGAGGGGGGSQPVTSTVTVTATSGLLQQTTTFSLTVN